MLKRRVLGPKSNNQEKPSQNRPEKTSPAKNESAPKPTAPNPQQNNQSAGAAPSHAPGSQMQRRSLNEKNRNQGRNRGRHGRNKQNQKGQGTPGGGAQGGNQGGNQQQPQQLPQQQRGGQRPQGSKSQQGRNQQRQGRNRRNQNRKPRPAPPPAYVQRDLLLFPNSDNTKGIEEVRSKFDPLAKKLPAHVTLLFPEHEGLISKDFLKSISVSELPSLRHLVFSDITVHDERYLWLLPNHESAEKLKQWHGRLAQSLPVHTQEETFSPHITLGYVPRSQTPEQAIAFARNLIQLPLELHCEKIWLEEFAENQNSKLVDSISVHDEGSGPSTNHESQPPAAAE